MVKESNTRQWYDFILRSVFKFTVEGDANRENSVVLMLTETGLILNLPIKTKTTPSEVE